MEPITLPTAVDRFVSTANAHDAAALFEVFAPGARVTDDGTTFDTPDGVREWIAVHQVGPRIVLAPTSYEGGRLIASVDGDFEGGPLRFAFDFSTRDELVTELAIAPA